MTFLKRGFYTGEPQARDYLEQIGCWFLTGLEYGMTVTGEREIAARLETVPWEYRGFAYEGASMGLTILDGLLPVGGRRLDRFAAGPAAHQIYTAHVGAGWAMARLPRVLQSRVRPRDPLLRWLTLDGYGFHEAYFHTPLVVGRQRPPGILPGWRGCAASAARVVDQGIGRALWFVCGADASRLAGTIAGFPASRRPDLWAGAGLAAAYAGYRTTASQVGLAAPEGLTGLRSPVGPQPEPHRQHAPEVAVPSAVGADLAMPGPAGAPAAHPLAAHSPAAHSPAAHSPAAHPASPAAHPAGVDPPGGGAQDTEASVRELATRAGSYLPDVAQGAAFAAKARHLAGQVTTHTVIAVRVLCGMTVAEAARCTDEALPADPAAADAYQTWRHRIRRRFRTPGE